MSLGKTHSSSNFNSHEENDHEDILSVDDEDTLKSWSKQRKVDISMVSTYISDLNTIKEEESEFERESEWTPTGFPYCTKTPKKGRHTKSKSEQLVNQELHFTNFQSAAQSCNSRKKFSDCLPNSKKIALAWKEAIRKGPKSP